MISRHLRRITPTALLTISLAVPPANAQTDVAGKAVTPTLAQIARYPTTIPDGLGGAYVGFLGSSFYVAHVDANGDPDAGWNLWGIGDLGVDFTATVIANPGPGKVWIGGEWASGTTHPNTVARPIRSFGGTVPDSSVTVTRDYNGISLVALDGGGVLVTATASYALRVGLIEPTGEFIERPDIGLSMTPAWHAGTISDGAGGAWIVCNAAYGNGSAIAAVRLAADGSPALTPAYRMVGAHASDQGETVFAGDGSGGVFIAWTDRRDLTKGGDVYATHLLADGSRAPGWQINSNPIASFPGDQFQPQIAADGSGGAWLAWTDGRSGVNDIYYTHLGANGAPRPGFPVGGSPLCAATDGQFESRIVADSEGGFYAVWQDNRNGNLDLYAQHIHSTGIVMPGWVADGLPICTDPTPQSSPALILSSAHHALTTWVDARNGTQKLYAATLPPDGSVTGVPPLTPGVALSVRAAQDPARGAVELIVSSPVEGEVRVTLHDVTGRVVAERVLQGPVNAASVQFAAARLGPGLYFARASRPGATTNTRVSLVR